MQNVRRIELPSCDANGGAGALAPEREIWYKGCAARDTRGAEGAQHGEV